MLRSPLQILNKVGLKKVQTTSWSVEGLYWDQWLTAAPPLIWEKKRWTLQVLLQYLGSEFILRMCVNWLHPGPAVLLSNCLQSARHDSRWPLISGFVVETCESSATALVCLTVFVLCVCVCVSFFPLWLLACDLHSGHVQASRVPSILFLLHLVPSANSRIRGAATSGCSRN